MKTALPLSTTNTTETTPPTLVSFKDLRPGDHAQIMSIAPSTEWHSQESLYAMGFTPGTCIEIVRSAPLGDPIQVKLRGSHLAIRKRDAEPLRLIRIDQGN